MKRIIPCLDIVNGRVVKGINFVDLADIGDPVEIAKKYQTDGANEVVFLDITATTENRDTFYDLLKKASQALSIPITVGGGIRTVEDFAKAFASGASKVSVNSAAVANPDLIRQASQKFGKDKVVAAIDAQMVDGICRVFVKGGSENSGLELIEWSKKCEELGAGEILLTTVSGDGTQSGYDIEMTKAVKDNVNIPVIASGGCGKIEDIVEVFNKTNCDAALVASLVHYGKATVGQIKSEMERNEISCKK